MFQLRQTLISIPVLFMTAMALLGVLGQTSPTSAFGPDGFGAHGVGTYLAIQEDSATILQIHRDGTMGLIFSGQFAGGVLSDPFSNTLGSWKRSGLRELTATTVDITFESEGGVFVGVAAATYIIKFDRWYQSARVTCKGEIYPPGVDPFSPDAEPISGSEFTCGEEGLVFHRLPNQGHGLRFSLG